MLQPESSLCTRCCLIYCQLNIEQHSVILDMTPFNSTAPLFRFQPPEIHQCLTDISNTPITYSQGYSRELNMQLKIFGSDDLPKKMEAQRARQSRSMTKLSIASPLDPTHYSIPSLPQLHPSQRSNLRNTGPAGCYKC